MLAAALQETENLATIEPETLKVPDTRIKNAESARKLFEKLREADKINARNRALEQAMFDGEPPYDDAELVESGQGHRCNLNFDEAAALLESAMGGYVDLTESVETLISTPLDRKKYPLTDLNFEHEKIIAEEFTRILREWDKFNFNHLLLATYFVKFGVGFSYFPDEHDWRWNVDSMANVFVPRSTFATESELELVCITRKYQAHQLYRFIKNEEAAEGMGWDVKETKRAIANACNKEPNSSDDYEKWAAELKNNDFYTGYANASEIAVVHYLWQEFDGTVSHCIGLEHPKETNGAAGEEKFLYQKRSRYDEMSKAIVAFTDGIGTNGYFHGIRGLGYKIFPQIQVSNRARCQFVDGAMMASSVMIQPKDADKMEDLELMYFGPYSVLSEGFDVVEQRAMPNLSQNIVPVLADMASLLQAKTGQYQSIPDKSERQSKFEIQTRVTQGAKLSSTRLMLFYQPFQRLLRQVGCRMTAEKYAKDDPGGKWVDKFRSRCVARGVPLEKIHSIDWDQAVVSRAIGGGSPEMRLLVLDAIERFVPSFDAIGRANWYRDRVAASLGYDTASRYVPPSTERRVSTDAKLAELENALMALGQPVSVSPAEDPIEHANVHLPKIVEIMEQAQQVPESLPQMVTILMLYLEHTSAHVEQIGNNPSAQQQAAEMRQVLQQAGEVAHNGALQLQKMEREAAAAQGQVAPAQDPRLVQQAEEFNLKMQRMQQEADLRLQIKQREHEQRMAIKDAEASKKLLEGQAA